MENSFNIRVYGIWMHKGQLLVNEEEIRGSMIIKFPGGGLHWGEGAIECLKREWLEELNIHIEVKGHFYTTDYFQPSAYDNSQVISIYYMVEADPGNPIRNTHPGERTYWMSAKDISVDTFTLPIDKIVGGMLQKSINNL